MKKLKIAVVAAGILLLAGCGNEPANKAGEVGVENKKNVSLETKNGDGGVISSIKDAMGLGKTMKCTYKMQEEDGEFESIAYIEGEKYSSEVKVAGINQKMVFDGKAMYSWEEGKKQGMKMTKDCMENMSDDFSQEDDSDIPEYAFEGEEAFEDAMDVKCEEVSRADFSVPGDIVFTDQCEMLKNMMNNLPSGITLPEGIKMPDLP